MKSKTGIMKNIIVSNTMLMKPILIKTTILAAVLLTACDPENFSQVVEVEIPEHEPRLVLNARFDSRAQGLDALVSNSLGILDTAQYSVFPEASVRLYIDGALFRDFQFEPEKALFFASLDEPLGNQPGLYRLEASTPGLGSVYAEQRMPRLVEIESVKVEKEGAVSGEGEKADEIKIQFTDPAGEDNYYAVRVDFLTKISFQPGDTVEYVYPLFTSTLDQIVQQGREYDHLFSGQSFDGNRYTLSLYAEYGIDFDDPNARVKVYLFSLSREAYLYDLSLKQYSDTADNPFAEPVTVFSNIEGGYGIFTLRITAELEAPVQ